MRQLRNVCIAVVGMMFIVAMIANAQPTVVKPAVKPMEKTMVKPVEKPAANPTEITNSNPQEKPVEGTTAKPMANAMMKPMSDSLRMDRMEHHLTMLKDSLSLTDEQTQKIRSIMMNEDKQMMASHDKYGTDFKAMQKARTELRATTDKEINAVLNKDQQAKYEQMLKNLRSSVMPKGTMNKMGTMGTKAPEKTK